MSKLITVLDNNNAGLTAYSKHGDENVEAIEALWKVIQLADIRGNYNLFIKKKITGQNGQTEMVKVLGVDSAYAVGVLFQSRSEYCYKGALSRASFGPQTKIGSALRDELTKVTGIKWFSIEHPNKVDHVQGVQEPLVPVEAALEAALPTPEPKLKTKPVVSLLQGLTKDKSAQKALFEEMAKMSRSRPLTNEIISDLILEREYGTGFRTNTEVSRKRSGPVLGCWTRRRLLEKIGGKGNVTTFKITERAIEAFQLQIEGVGSAEATPAPGPITPPPAPMAEVTAPLLMPSTITEDEYPQPSVVSEEELPQPQEPPRIEATPVSSIISASDKIRELAERMIASQKEIYELKAHRVAINLRIEELEKFLKSPECQEMERMKTLLDDLFPLQPAP